MVSEKENSWETNSARVLKVQVLTVLFIVALNFLAKAAVDKNHSVTAHALIYEKWKLLLSKPERADILIVGDSSAAFAIDPNHLSEKTGRKVQNLATAAHLIALDDAWVFNHYVETVGAPRVVVMMRYFPYWELDSPSALLQSTIPLPWKYWERLKPGVTSDWPHNFNLWLGRYLPLYRRSWSVQRLVRFWRRGLRVESVKPSGALNLSYGPDMEFRRGRVLADRLEAEYPFTVSEVNLFALESIINTCERNGVTLVLANPPVHRADFEEDHYRRYMDALKEGLTKFAAGQSRVRFMMQEPVVLEESQLFDSIHAKPEAAKMVTDKLFKELKDASQGK